MRKTLVFLLSGMVLFLSSCDPAKIYEKHMDNEKITWSRFDAKTFTVDIENVSSAFDFYVALRHLDAFPFDYITIKCTMYTPSGETRILEQKIKLKDEKGNWRGDGMGDLWDINHLVWKEFRFSQPGTCTIEVASSMSQAVLPGIMQVGLIVKKTK